MEQPNLITITITMDPATGQVAVTGPIDKTLVCYGLLELARDVIADVKRKAEQRLVQPAAALGVMPSPFHKGS